MVEQENIFLTLWFFSKILANFFFFYHENGIKNL